MASIGKRERELAADAYADFGKRKHPASHGGSAKIVIMTIFLLTQV